MGGGGLEETSSKGTMQEAFHFSSVWKFVFFISTFSQQHVYAVADIIEIAQTTGWFWKVTSSKSSSFLRLFFSFLNCDIPRAVHVSLLFVQQ